MTPEEIKTLVEATVDNSAGMSPLVVILLIATTSIAAFVGAYLKEKAKSAVTKEDIEEITQKIENVKKNIEAIKAAETTKYNLKYTACLQALGLIDAHFSYLLTPPKEGDISKQSASTKDARDCHSKLILSCESTELIEKFNRIMFGQTPEEKDPPPPTDLLNEFRNLIRHELGFGKELKLDRDRAWFGKINCEKDNG